MCENYGFSTEITHFTFSTILSIDRLDEHKNASTVVEIFNTITKVFPLKWNIFQSIFFSIRKLFLRGVL